MAVVAEFKFDKDVIRMIEQNMINAPPMMRERILKKAMKEAAEVFTYKVRNNIRGLKAAGRDRWGKETEIDLKDAIRTKPAKQTKTRVGMVVDIHADGKKFAELKQYAVSVEYGHKMVIYGTPIEGRRVQQHPFWRPARTSSGPKINSVMERAIKRAMKELLYRKK